MRLYDGPRGTSRNTCSPHGALSQSLQPCLNWVIGVWTSGALPVSWIKNLEGVRVASGFPEDNNYLENQIRPFAQGRRAWLFAQNPYGAKASANLYSLVSCARVNGLEPYAYLVHLLEELPKTTTADALEALLPWNVKAVLQARRAA